MESQEHDDVEFPPPATVRVDELKSLLNRSIIYVSAAAEDNPPAQELFHEIRQAVPYE